MAALKSQDEKLLPLCKGREQRPFPFPCAWSRIQAVHDMTAQQSQKDGERDPVQTGKRGRALTAFKEVLQTASVQE